MIGEKVVELLYPSCGPNGCLDPADLAVKQKNVTHGVNRSSLCLTVFAFVFRLRDGESRSALAGRIDFGEIELRDKRPDRVPLLEDCSFRLLRTKLFSAAKDFVFQVYSLLPSCFALETAKAVPPCQGGAGDQKPLDSAKQKASPFGGG